MKLQLGLIGISRAWEKFAQQEGIALTAVDPLKEEIGNVCSVLVIARHLTNAERMSVEEYLRGGGALLGDADHFHGVAGTTATQERLEYILSDDDRVLSGIFLLDLGLMGFLPREANALRTPSNTFAVFAGSLGGGWAVILPFNVDAALNDARAANKNFYSTRDRLPAERVSLVSKGEVAHLLHRSLEYLHHARGLPYVHLWYYPEDRRTLFAFRIDTDRASRADIDALYDIGREYQIDMSWYLDVKSQERWLSHFSFMVGQEIGVHGYEHQTFPDFETNLKNIRRAVHLLEGVGIRPRGCTAPFGIWNPELARVLDDIGFEYSSEFAYLYDALPAFPVSGGKEFATMQVPIHPVCIGSMMRVGYAEEHMKEYFARTIAWKVARSEPLFFYHHPAHRKWNVVREIFREIREREIDVTTLGSYARWWKERLRCRLTAELSGELITIHRANAQEQTSPGDVWVRVSRKDGEESILPVIPVIDANALAQRTRSLDPTIPPEDIRRIREFDPRALLGEMFTTLTRKFR
jgi:hypothetical protein